MEDTLLVAYIGGGFVLAAAIITPIVTYVLSRRPPAPAPPPVNASTSQREDMMEIERLINRETDFPRFPRTELVRYFTANAVVTIKGGPLADAEDCRTFEQIADLYKAHKQENVLQKTHYRHDEINIEILSDGNTAVATSCTKFSRLNADEQLFFFQAWKFLKSGSGPQAWRIAQLHGGLNSAEAIAKRDDLKT